MSMKKIEGLITLLKYLDNDFISDEQYELIGHLDINNLEHQKQIIRTILVPSYQEFNKVTQESIKDLMKECLQNKVSYEKLFNGISLPFEANIVDKTAFLENIYEELFGEKANN